MHIEAEGRSRDPTAPFTSKSAYGLEAITVDRADAQTNRAKA